MLEVGDEESLPLEVFVQLAQQAELRYEQGNDLAALDDALTAWNCVLSHPELQDGDATFRIAAWNDAGGAFLSRYWERELSRIGPQRSTYSSRRSRRYLQTRPALPALQNNLATALTAPATLAGQHEDLGSRSAIPAGGSDHTA